MTRSKKKAYVSGPTTHGVRRLTSEELQELRRDMAESSAWAKQELKRRRMKSIQNSD